MNVRFLPCALLFSLSAFVVASVGCGTTRTSFTHRTATEQLLVSDAIDRAVSEIDFRALAGQGVHLDSGPLQGVVDKEYLTSSLRQHLLASGCILREERDKADFIVEARAGAVGTDNHNLLFGIPAMQVPQILPLQGVVPSAIPEVPFAKRQEQRGLAKVAVFAYHRETGMPVWQSGIAASESNANDFWILGAGPFKKGTIYETPTFAGTSISNPILDGGKEASGTSTVQLTEERSFAAPNLFADLPEPATTPPSPMLFPTTPASPVQQASHTEDP